MIAITPEKRLCRKIPSCQEACQEGRYQRSNLLRPLPISQSSPKISSSFRPAIVTLVIDPYKQARLKRGFADVGGQLELPLDKQTVRDLFLRPSNALLNT